MFTSGLARRTAQRRRLHPQTLHSNRVAAILAIAEGFVIQTLQGGLHLRHFVDVALLLHATKIEHLPLRRVVLAVRYFVSRVTGQLALSLHGGIDLGSQFPQAVVERIAHLRQMSLGGQVHGLQFR